jgi:hypothetical protein
MGVPISWFGRARLCVCVVSCSCKSQFRAKRQTKYPPNARNAGNGKPNNVYECGIYLKLGLVQGEVKRNETTISSNSVKRRAAGSWELSWNSAALSLESLSNQDRGHCTQPSHQPIHLSAQQLATMSRLVYRQGPLFSANVRVYHLRERVTSR